MKTKNSKSTAKLSAALRGPAWRHYPVAALTVLQLEGFLSRNARKRPAKLPSFAAPVGAKPTPTLGEALTHYLMQRKNTLKG